MVKVKGWMLKIGLGLMAYVRSHSFKVFGIYRIVLGVLVLGYFLIGSLL